MGRLVLGGRCIYISVKNILLTLRIVDESGDDVEHRGIDANDYDDVFPLVMDWH